MLLDKQTPPTPQIRESIDDLGQFPYLVSVCITGVRVFISKGKIYDLLGKPIKNKRLNELASKMNNLEDIYEGVVNLAFRQDLNEIKEVLNSYIHVRDIDLIIHIHDIQSNEEYSKRLLKITEEIPKLKEPNIAYLPQQLIYSIPQLKKYVTAIKTNGYDGIITRPIVDTYSTQVLNYLKV